MRYSLVIAAVAVIFFAVQAVVPGFTEALLLRSSDAAARPWIFLTSMFLHGDFSHLAFNMVALLVFGLILESVVSKKHFLMIYFAGGIAAGISAAFFYTAALGASGAIFALIGTLAVMRPRMTVWAFGVPMPMFAAAIFWMSADLIGLFAPTTVANAAHLAGLFFGIAFGLAIRKKYPAPKRSGRRQLISDYEIDEWEESYLKGEKK
ncbi:MAG: rhomboid family intramembrane serine protease [Candidatus Aenigmarchaeota archaeon]|nr:rhomboid family intramembrane serine protease [Candidatus Aenigmarchaeota archaeon]